MPIFKEIAEYYLFSSLQRFKKNVFSEKSHKKVVLEQGDKKRIVFVPNKIVKCAQNYFLTHYLEPLSCSGNCFSYLKGKSIVDMAEAHIGNGYFLHLDIKHYFNNMDFETFKNCINANFNNSKLNRLFLKKADEKEVRAILTFRGKFRQGSVTSPYVSNLYLFELDEFLNEYVKKNISKGIYTRYSDDIIISSDKRINKSIILMVKEQLKRYKLRLNYKKIKFSNIYSSVRVTGLTITQDGRTTINTKMKNKIKSMVYKLLERNEKTNFNVLYGYIYYLIMCDPLYFNRLQNKYQKDNMLMMERIKAVEERKRNENIDTVMGQ